MMLPLLVGIGFGESMNSFGPNRHPSIISQTSTLVIGRIA
jgi:hypothetical protein